MLKKLKNFCRLTRRSEGFTLVELVVVIAIVAILSGIAVPAYGAYVEKSQKAGDLQLLAAVNKAFAAACMENGIGVENVRDAKLKPDDAAPMTMSAETSSADDDSYAIIGVEYVHPKNGTADEGKIDESFQKYYEDNMASQFKAIKFAHLKFVNGVFVDVTTNPEGIVSFSYGGGTVYLSEAEAAALAASTFLTAETLNGSNGLLDQVNFVTEMAAGMAGGQLNAVFNDPAFMKSAMDALGTKTQEEYIAKQEKILAKMMEGGLTREQAEAQMGANAAVLYAAQNAVKYSNEDLNKLFTGTGVNTIKTNLTTTGKTTDGMAQAALVYGMYTAYAHSDKYGNATLQANTNNALTVLNALENDANFKEYVLSDAGQKDMSAYMGALGMISDSATNNPDAVEHLMINGFNNDDLKKIVAEATGK